MRITRQQAIERLYPNALALALAIVSYCAEPIYSINKELHDDFNAILTAATIAVGFLGVVMSILLTIDSAWIMKRARESGAYSQLVEYILQATRSAFLLAIFSVLWTLAKTDEVYWWFRPLTSAFWGWGTLTGLQIYRLFDILGTIMRAIADPDHK